MQKRSTRSEGVPKKGGGRVVLVTGGSGRLGRTLIKELLGRGYSVRALVQRKESLLSMPVGIVPFLGDVGNRKVLAGACDGAYAVFHLAAIVSEYREMMPKLMHVNVEGTANVIDAASMKGVRKFIYTSTVDVYGHVRKDVLKEDSELRPADKYGYSKMMAEKEIERYTDMDYTILRMAAMYGPGFEKSYLKVLRAIKDGKAYIIGDGANHLALVHVDDVVRALLLALENNDGKRRTFNIGDGIAYTQEQLFRISSELMGIEVPKRHISPLVVRLIAKKRGLDSDELRFLLSDRVLDVSKAKKELGFAARMKLRETSVDLIKQLNKVG
ncbi:MAG: NAD(P)-dependent oxidoreductase [Candidatus Micrarchaeota archaeon]|nr:NAD(P)-dependent oxidoreductase [Candidatus Micrarchaeota archaeon]